MAHGDNPSNKTKNNKTKNNKTRLARLLIFILLIGSLLSEGFFSRAQFAAAFDYNNAYAEPYLETKTVSEPTGTEARGTYPVEAYEGDGPENTRNFEYMMGGDVVYRATDWDGADQALMSYNRTVDDLGEGLFQVRTRLGGYSYNETSEVRKDVVIVLDNSSTMDLPNAEGQTRLQQANESIDRFVTNFLSTELDPYGNNRVALVTYGSDVFDGRTIAIDIHDDGTNQTTRHTYQTKDATTGFTRDAEEIIGALPWSVPSPSGYEGGTFTQAALDYAQDLFNDPNDPLGGHTRTAKRSWGMAATSGSSHLTCTTRRSIGGGSSTAIKGPSMTTVSQQGPKFA